MAEQKIEKGMLVKVGGGHDRVPIATMNPNGRVYEREKRLAPGRFLFGTVKSVREGSAFVEWAGPKYRTSVLPVGTLTSAINQAKLEAKLIARLAKR